MKLLLDTHVMLWWWTAPDRIPHQTLEVLSAPETIILASAVSGYEMSYKQHCGKLSLPTGLMKNFQSVLKAERWTELPIQIAHTLLAGQIASLHRDPFDRLLAAQSRLENAKLVGADPAFQTFPDVPVLW